MDSSQGISSLLGQGEHLLVVIRQVIGVAPGQEDQLAVAVDAVVEDPVTLNVKFVVSSFGSSPHLSLQNVVAHMDSLNL